MTQYFENRESWLEAAIAEFQQRIIEPQGFKLPEKLKVSVGFPPRARGGKTLGVCIAPEASANGSTETFINPTIGDPEKALGVLLHELVHACAGVKAGHGPVFKRAAAKIGLEGSAKTCLPGAPLRAYIRDDLLPVLGDYPHSALDLNGGQKKQTTRMIKLVDPKNPSYSVRSTRKVLSMGYPVSPLSGEVMVEG